MSRVLNQNFLNCSEDRIINYFPSSFLNTSSPYLTIEFNEKVRKYLLDNSSTNCLRVGKVIIIGDVYVGKTCLVNKFCRKIFDCNYKSTIGVDFEIENFQIFNFPFSLQIWDTAGQERFKSIAQSYYRGAHAVVIVFDLTNLDTLYNCQTWFKEASHSFSSNVPFLFLVGTKKDLLKRYAYNNAEECAIKMASKLNAEYWSVSSKTGQNVDNLFKRIAALTFQNCVKMELDSGTVTKVLGTKLIAVTKKNTFPDDKGHCTSNKCMK